MTDTQQAVAPTIATSARPLPGDFVQPDNACDVILGKKPMSVSQLVLSNNVYGVPTTITDGSRIWRWEWQSLPAGYVRRPYIVAKSDGGSTVFVTEDFTVSAIAAGLVGVIDAQPFATQTHLGEVYAGFYSNHDGDCGIDRHMARVPVSTLAATKYLTPTVREIYGATQHLDRSKFDIRLRRQHDETGEVDMFVDIYTLDDTILTASGPEPSWGQFVAATQVATFIAAITNGGVDVTDVHCCTELFTTALGYRPIR